MTKRDDDTSMKGSVLASETVIRKRHSLLCYVGRKKLLEMIYDWQ